MPSTWPFPKPRIPKLEDRFNFIWRNFTDPCDTPVTVWIETLLPALEHALIAWFYIDLIQVVRTMWTPPVWGWRNRLRSHYGPENRNNKRGLKGKVGKGLSFDPSSWVGKQLSPFADEEMVMLLPGEIWFWTATEAIVFEFFAYSVLDIGTGFFYEWASGVAQTQYCAARDDAVLYATAPGYPLLGIFGWDAVGLLNPVKQRNIDFFNGFGVAQSVGPGVVGLTFEYLNIGGGLGPPWIECRMNCLTGPRTGTYAMQRVATGDLVGGSGGCTYDMQADEVWIGEIRVNGAWSIINPVLFCHAHGFRET